MAELTRIDREVRRVLLDAARAVYRPREKPVGRCAVCRCDVFEGDGSCGDAVCPVKQAAA